MPKPPKSSTPKRGRGRPALSTDEKRVRFVTFPQPSTVAAIEAAAEAEGIKATRYAGRLLDAIYAPKSAPRKGGEKK